jgi:hypothetical protein
VIVATNAADSAGDEMSIPRIFALHENAVSAEDGRSAVALDHFASVEINLGKNAQAANDARDRVPIHFNQLA